MFPISELDVRDHDLGVRDRDLGVHDRVRDAQEQEDLAQDPGIHDRDRGLGLVIVLDRDLEAQDPDIVLPDLTNRDLEVNLTNLQKRFQSQIILITII